MASRYLQSTGAYSSSGLAVLSEYLAVLSEYLAVLAMGRVGRLGSRLENIIFRRGVVAGGWVKATLWGAFQLATKESIMPKTDSKNSSVMEMPLSELTRRIEKVEALLKEAQALLPGLRTLTEEDRRHSNGRLRGGEAEMLSRVLDAVRTQPGYFASLADEDDGRDPTKLEVDLIADRLARRNLLARLQGQFAAIEQPLSDSVLHLGEQTRTVLLAAYRIGRTLARSDGKLRDQLAPVIDYYGGMVRRSKGSEDAPHSR